MTPTDYPAAITETAFDCPHCGAYTTQTWFQLYSKRIDQKARIPYFPDDEWFTLVKNDTKLDPELKRQFISYYEDISTGLVFFKKTKDELYRPTEVKNLHLSKCYNCNKIAVWVHEMLVFPPQRHGYEPNQDIPDDILKDYEEARSIVELSPRGAAALLRLAIQKLCKHLGESGKNIDKDIASLVEQGLPPKVQKSLDIVRVVGNESVHPGTIDLRDNREAAGHLFGLVNIIAEQMITIPNHVDAMYDSLPESKRMAIEKRDGKGNDLD